MASDRDLWAVVLAAGSGTRLRAVTTDSRGVPVPKQYCRFLGTKSMLCETLDRATRIVAQERTLVVVAAEHEGWWRRELEEFPPENILVQPRNRGTAAGVLLPTLEILRRDPRSVLVSLPSDHYVEDESVLQETLMRCVRAVERGVEGLVLLGITPEHPETGYGWILPYSDRNGEPSLVGSFVEKPPESAARDLMSVGALWNSFIWVAPTASVLRLYARTVPRLLRAFSRFGAPGGGSPDPTSLRQVYDAIPSLDFSSDVLERSRRDLWVQRVPPCGWSDLGTPERLRECMRRTRVTVDSPMDRRVVENLPVVTVS
jgi:mannose-1-phosphate guanylyltransferase